MEFCVTLQKLVRGIYGEEAEKSLSRIPEDYNNYKVNGTTQEAREFYAYVDRFKKENPQYKDIEDSIFIEAANINNVYNNLSVVDKELYREIEDKLFLLFAILDKFADTENDLFKIKVEGSLLFRSTLTPFDLVAFGGKNSLNRFIALVRAVEMLKPEKIKEFNDWEKFHDLSIFEDEYGEEKHEMLENHLISLRNLRELKYLDRLTKIETNLNGKNKDKWDYRFCKEDVDGILDYNKGGSLDLGVVWYSKESDNDKYSDEDDYCEDSGNFEELEELLELLGIKDTNDYEDLDDEDYI